VWPSGTRRSVRRPRSVSKKRLSRYEETAIAGQTGVMLEGEAGSAEASCNPRCSRSVELTSCVRRPRAVRLPARQLTARLHAARHLSLRGNRWEVTPTDCKLAKPMNSPLLGRLSSRR